MPEIFSSEKAFALIVVVALSFFLVELPRIEAGVPLHSDEYDNIAASQDLLSGNLFYGDPFASSQERSVHFQRPFFDPEFGYVALLSLVSLLPFASPTNLHFFFPWLVSILIFFASFKLLKELCRNDFVAFFASFFVFFLPSSQLMLGPAFMVASSLGLALLPLLLLLGYRHFTNPAKAPALRQGTLGSSVPQTFKKFDQKPPWGLTDIGVMQGSPRLEVLWGVIAKRNSIEFFALLVVSVFVYAPAAVLAVASLLSFSLLSREIFGKNRREILAFLLIPALLLVLYPIFLLVSSGLDAVRFFSSDFPGALLALVDFILRELVLRPAQLEQIPFLHDYMGLPLFLFSLIALAFLVRKSLHGRRDLYLLAVPAVIFSLTAFLGTALGKTIVVPTERLTLFSAWFLLIISGVFAAELVLRIKEYLEQKSLASAQAKLFPALSVILVSLLMLASQPFQAGSLELNIQKNEFGSIDWINENTPKGSMVFAAPFISKPIHVYTGRLVACTTSTRFGCPDRLNELASSFFFASCADKERILSDFFRADYVLAHKRLSARAGEITFPEQDCPFLSRVFEGNNHIIYKTERHY